MKLHKLGNSSFPLSKLVNVLVNFVSLKIVEAYDWVHHLMICYVERFFIKIESINRLRALNFYRDNNLVHPLWFIMF